MDWFDAQLKLSEPLTAEQISEMKSTPFLGDEFKVGDRMIGFTEIVLDDDSATVSLQFRATVERKIPQILRDYKFLQMDKSIPRLLNPIEEKKILQASE